ncbi:MAG: RNA-binding protein [uncultured bacterium (gcode 4)]|uniref:RNA-binding protein KhpA n=1 Tax=uncultured bacterium (gcode 4) TaxID=1234023 RepID=K2BU65_9BACT|nr:MAG: RNA-binding protein [uncultured bacterium (gcode 4)]MDP2103601.1 KH domain-containing protein [Candidatus Gracilibacteria bacterium]
MSPKDFLLFIINSLVTNEGDVSIEQREDDLGTLLSLKVNKNDMGTIIGKDGKTINAIRTVLRVYGSKSDARVNLKVIEE